MVPSNSNCLSHTASFHFHDYRRKSSCLNNPSLRKTCFWGKSCLSHPLRIRISNILLQKLRRSSFFHPTLDQAFLSFKRFSNLILKQKHFFQTETSKLVWVMEVYPKKLETEGTTWQVIFQVNWVLPKITGFIKGWCYESVEKKTHLIKAVEKTTS